MSKKECFISVVIPVRDNASILKGFLQELQHMLYCSFTDYEIVVVDGGSRDHTEEVMADLLLSIPSVRFIALSETVVLEVASSAGLENAIGDIVVLMCPNHDPVDIIPQAIDKALAGNDVLVGISKTEKSVLYSFISRLFRILFSQLINYDVPKDSTNFRILSRRALNSVLLKNKYLHHLFVDISRVGYSKGTVSYNQLTRSSQQSRKGIFGGIRKALSVLVFNSTAPLRLMNMVGVFASVLGLVASIYVIAVRLFNDAVVEGWTSLALFMSLQFTLLFMILFFYGEYLVRLVEEFHDKEGYDVTYEKSSAVMLNEERWNIMNDSTTVQPNEIQVGRYR